MAKRSMMWRQWFGAVVVGVAAMVGAAGVAWGQGAKPDKAAAAGIEAVQALIDEASRLRGEGRYDEAILLAERALTIVEREAGKDDPDVAALLNIVAELYEKKGDQARAALLYERVLVILENVREPDHRLVAITVNNLAQIYQAKGDYARAEPLLQRALASAEKAFGPLDPVLMVVLNNLAAIYLEEAKFEQAEAVYMRAVTIGEKIFGPNHPQVAIVLNGLAFLYTSKGDYARAEQNHLRGIEILEKSLGLAHPEIALSLNNLALLYKMKGDYVRAEALYRRAGAILMNKWGSEHADVALVLTNLGQVYYETGDHTHAEEAYLAALETLERVLGPDHPRVAFVVGELGRLYYSKSDYTQAEKFFLRALRMEEKALGLGHPHTANSLHSLGAVYESVGDYARAEAFGQRALGLAEKALGPDHPRVAESLRSLGGTHLAQNAVQIALQEHERAASIDDRNAVRELAVGTDEQRRAYMQLLLPTTSGTISLHVQSASRNEDAKRLALRTILRRKGLILDAMANSFAILRQRLAPEDQQKFDKWRSLTARYTSLAQRQPDSAALKTINEERQRIENELSFRSKDLQAQLTPVTIEQVRAAIPKNAVLVELYRYQPFNPKARGTENRWGSPRFVAYVLHTNGHIDFADLGDAKLIEDASKVVRNALARVATDPKPAAQRLHQLVLAPIQKFLGETRHVYLSPDSALNLVPFGIMVDKNGHYLAESLSITYLASGRDLARMGISIPSRERATIFAGPDYEAGNNPQTRPRRQFAPLLYTATEAQSISRSLGGTSIIDGATATEAAIKALHAPKILHISTHGFFEKDDPVPNASPDKKISWLENPLLRSGLAFAGANRSGVGNEDGVLTALEAAQLDLHGTKLVVLSACETGNGKAENGDGVYGLRRAFAIAGAETVVMSLWQVDANATTDLMKAYYQGLSQNGGRAEALRRAQLAMLSSNDRSHPHYWASFIVSGDDRSMDGKLVDPALGRVNRGGACGACEIAGSTSGDEHGGILAMAIGAGIVSRRRRR